jgi:suppressor of G2 allele of SKP1
MDQAARGDAALAAHKYEEAVKEYTSAISSNNRAVPYYIKRSTAYHRQKKYSEALADAEAAVMLARSRGKRELIKEAQLRRALALLYLERYADADFVLGIVKKLDDKDKTVPVWEMKIQNKLKDLTEDDERGKQTAEEYPEVELPVEKAPEKEAKETPAQTPAEQSDSTTPSAPQASVQTPPSKIRHEFYDTNDNVVISLFAKGVPKDKLSVGIEKHSLDISFPTAFDSNFDFSLDPLFAEIDPSKSSYRLTPTKIEVTLKKVVQGQKWKVLEGDHSVDVSAKPTSIPQQILTSKATEQPPSYPTSSRKGVKNWDKLAQGEGKDDDEDGDATAKFFKTLYAGATPEQQRAMMKSYQESGGTVLSTDWSQVGSKTVVPEPPEGMEAKKWNE